MKNLLLFLLLCLAGHFAFAQTAFDDPKTGSPYFQLDVEGAKFPLHATNAEVNISGVIADVTVTQTYVNDGSERLEATYVFPGSNNSAVYGMTMIIGNRRIKGEIQRKAEARETYEQAKEEGKRASLLEQHRPNVFQMNVANILPGDTVKVELKYTELIVPTNGIYSFVYPTVMGPRYVSPSEDAESFTAQPYLKSSVPTYDFGLNVYLNAGMPITTVASPSHKVVTTRYEEAVAIDLAGSESKGGNRDFVLNYQLQGKEIQTGMITFEGEDENYFLYMAQPPAEVAEGDYPPREFVFVVDVSGSMNGFPLDVSKELLTNLVAQLRPVDQFNIILFAGASDVWQDQSVAANQANLQAGLNFLQSARSGGGTELLPALQTAYALPRSFTGLSRNIVIVTDGYVGVEPEAFDLIRTNLNKANVYSFGIGSGINRHLIDGMARVGQGRPAYILDPSEAEAEAERFQEYISEPVLTELSLDFGDKFAAYEVEPISIPDVSRERPLIVFGKYRGKARGKMTLTGYGGYVGLKATGGPTGLQSIANPTEADYRKQVFTYNLKDAKNSERHAALAQLWAREKIRRLDDYNDLSYGGDDALIEEVTELGLAYNLLTQYTSFVAVEELIVADPNDPMQTVAQPLPLPENVAATAVGFDLGVMGIAGLPTEASTVVWHWSIFALGAIILFLIGYRVIRKKGWPPFGGFGAGRDLSATLPILLLAFCFASCDSARIDLNTTTDIKLNQTEGQKITFILGEDEGTNAYYGRAAEYFRWHPEEGGETVITDMQSIAEVRNYLALTQVPGGWEKVNIVVHGNQWTGLATKLEPTSQEARVTSNQLANWTPKTRTHRGTITDQTEIIVHGCSVGKDTALLLQLSRVFAGRDGAYPTVTASEDFTLFREGENGVERRYADYVYRATPLGKYPLPKVMATRLRRQHPDKKVDWDAALSNNRFTEDLVPHLYQFNVPVRWTRVYPEADAVADPEGTESETEWLAGEQQLTQTLDKMGLTPKQFLWDFSNEDYQLADGGTLPAITATGVARLFCVLLPRSVEEGTEMVSLRWSS
ncbi:VIT domain-containing protein [Lewinella sp. 4G2]|uniref:VIT domain-containing protein n=1 Tax=Lewinella sp. 4G2 TaxID=1803372 RepID=UPI000AB9E49C|nr:VIT domain-containing protein [Lewinella sp. 4G2]